MTDNWRTVQLFLDSKEFKIYEVKVNPEDKGIKAIKCDCKQYALIKACKHVEFISKAMVKNNGHYPIKVATEINDKAVIEAMEDEETFRDFIIRNAKIEVIK